MRLALLLLLAAGCSKSSKDGVHLKQVNDSFVSAGFKLDSFQPTDPGRFSAQKCVQGQLEGVDSVVCEYGSAEAVTMGRKAGEDWIAQATTGAVLTNGSTLLAVADRGRVDPNGKVIHKITQAYSKTK
jgi:hypothetical protein